MGNWAAPSLIFNMAKMCNKQKLRLTDLIKAFNQKLAACIRHLGWGADRPLGQAVPNIAKPYKRLCIFKGLCIGVGFGFKNRVQNRFSEASEPRIVNAQKPNF